MGHHVVKIGQKYATQAVAVAVAKPKPKPVVEYVDIYIGDEFAFTIPEHTLVRFSRVAALAFPKSMGNGTKNTQGGAMKDDGTKKDEATHSQNKVFKVELVGMTGKADPTALHEIYRWMDVNQYRRGNQALGKLYVSDESKDVSLPALVEIYAAVLALDIRPFPVHLCEAIKDILTQEKPLAAEIKLIDLHIPKKDPVHKRMVTSYFEYYDRGQYSVVEETEIVEYVESDDRLYNHFNKIADLRWKHQQEYQREVTGEATRAQEEWRLYNVVNSTTAPASTNPSMAGNEETTSSMAVTVSSDNQSAQVMRDGFGNERGGRKQKKSQENSKGVGGRHVPGA